MPTPASPRSRPDVELPADKVAQIADFLLGQQNGKPRQATRRLLRSSNGARAWAETVRAQLEGARRRAARAAERGAAPPGAGGRRAGGAGRSRARARGDAPPAPARARRDQPARPDAPASAPPSGAPAPRLLAGRRRGADRRSRARDRRRRARAVRVPRRRRGAPGKRVATATPTATAAQPSRGSASSRSRAPAPRAARPARSRVYAQQKQLLFALQVKNMPPTPGGKSTRSGCRAPAARPRLDRRRPEGRQERGAAGPGPAAVGHDLHARLRRLPAGPDHAQTGTARKRPGPTLVRGTLPAQASRRAACRGS